METSAIYRLRSFPGKTIDAQPENYLWITAAEA